MKKTSHRQPLCLGGEIIYNIPLNLIHNNKGHPHGPIQI